MSGFLMLDKGFKLPLKGGLTHIAEDDQRQAAVQTTMYMKGLVNCTVFFVILIFLWHLSKTLPRLKRYPFLSFQNVLTEEEHQILPLKRL